MNNPQKRRLIGFYVKEQREQGFPFNPLGVVWHHEDTGALLTHFDDGKWSQLFSFDCKNKR
jgi:hypothetical protein